MSFSRPCRIHQHTGTDVVVMVRLFIKVRMRGFRIPDLDSGPLHSVSTAFTNIFMVRANRITEIVQQVMIPFSSRCQFNVMLPDVTLSLKFP